jgi:hypothetical protein
MKIADNWDISHIGIAVSDLDDAMDTFATALGVEWSPVLSLNTPIATPLYPDEDIAMEGLREVWSTKGPSLELCHAMPGSPAERIWGVAAGNHKMHHICYWVEDLRAASQYLVEHGFALEMTVAPGDVVDGFTYNLHPAGTRLQLMPTQDKPTVLKFLETGVLELDR